MTHQASATTLLTIRQVRARTGMGETYIYEGASDGRFPKPVKVGRASRWVEAEVEAWNRARIAERDMGKDMGTSSAASV